MPQNTCNATRAICAFLDAIGYKTWHAGAVQIVALGKLRHDEYLSNTDEFLFRVDAHQLGAAHFDVLAEAVGYLDD